MKTSPECKKCQQQWQSNRAQDAAELRMVREALEQHISVRAEDHCMLPGEEGEALCDAVNRLAERAGQPAREYTWEDIKCPYCGRGVDAHSTREGYCMIQEGRNRGYSVMVTQKSIILHHLNAAVKQAKAFQP